MSYPSTTRTSKAAYSLGGSFNISKSSFCIQDYHVTSAAVPVVGPYLITVSGFHNKSTKTKYFSSIVQ